MRSPAIKTVAPPGPFRHLQVDYITLPKCEGKQDVLVIVDKFSRWIECYPTSKGTAAHTAKMLVQDFIPRWGLPEQIESDQGTHFTGQVVQAICKLLKVNWKLHCPYRPQASGQVERVNRVIKERLTKLHSQGVKWTAALPAVLCSIRATSNKTVGLSPYEVVTEYATDNYVSNRLQEESSDITRRNLELIFKDLEHKVISLVKNQLKRFVKLLSVDYPACSEREVEDEEDQSGVREGALKITLTVLKNMNQTDLANILQTKLASSCHQNLKSTLKNKFQKITEGIPNLGTSTLLNEIYTELYVTEGGSGEVNKEHEVRQIETASRRQATQDKAIKCNDLFEDKSIRTVLTKGIAGIGKTVSVQKFILDWAEGKANQDVPFIFPLPFRELNLMKKTQISMLALLHQFFTDIKALKPRDYHYYKVRFIFDGLDECRLPLDFQNNESLVM
ncbi:hypothetical protein SRHO_G00247130 [Serrasalmus rhombeus]